MSEEYLNNIKLVDQGVKEMVYLIEDFYNNDGRTSYVFTADHGMNNRGNKTKLYVKWLGILMYLYRWSW
jgi:hypothetical protein